MITEMKTVVVQDGKVIFVGDWDYEIEEINGESIVFNPLPEGAKIEQIEMVYSVEKGWQLDNVAKPPSLEERLDQMEIMIINLLEVL